MLLYIHAWFSTPWWLDGLFSTARNCDYSLATVAFDVDAEGTWIAWPAVTSAVALVITAYEHSPTWLFTWRTMANAALQNIKFNYK